MIPFGAMVFAVSTLFFAVAHGALWEAFARPRAWPASAWASPSPPCPASSSGPSPHETGSATGFYQVLRNIGLSVGSALGAAILTGYTHAGHDLPDRGGLPHRAAGRRRAVRGHRGRQLRAPRRRRQPSCPVREDRTAGVEERMEEEAELAGAGLMLAEERLPPVPGSGS